MRLYALALLCFGIGTAALGAVSDAIKSSFERPLTIPFPPNAPYSLEKATLGKMLFFDPRLSGAQNMSCASCHNPSFRWETPVDLAVGAANTPLGRHAPTMINSAWIEPLFWDGRAQTLEEQAAGPITAAVEMNATFDQVLTRLNQVEEYVSAFNRIFPNDGLTQETILDAIATFERTVVSGWSPFDRWIDGDENAISEQAKRGFDVFTGRGECASCHIGWNMTDNAFHDIGLVTDDVGRGALEPDNPMMQFAYKTPGLRNIALRAPYMHAGQLDTLEEVVLHYAGGGAPRPSLSPQMSSLELSDQDVQDVIVFLNTLTEEQTDVLTPILPANCVHK
ncbi:cytochrome-c peroxidase [Algirhabdus cladophorae]|uniref:cytochrome-c peroxidase n=1 Tax=Algirhabdus cladophorae TaxID=3377108 RepID=UPI003B847A21